MTFPETMDQIDQWILCDAVTSGGLLISVAGEEAESLLSDLQKAGVEASLIGEVTKENPEQINVSFMVSGKPFIMLERRKNHCSKISP